MTSIFSFSAVEAKRPTTESLRELIRLVMKADNDACSDEMTPYMLPPGICGSREYDHARTVDILLRHDALAGGNVAASMKANKMSERMLFDEIVKVYRKAGFKLSHGRIVGLLVDDSNGGAEATNERADSVE